MSDEDDESGCDCKPGLPAYMGTFADLMSLLMCFFVLLLSFSEMDATKFKKLAGSLAQAFGVQQKLDVMEVPKGTSIIAQEFSPGRPEPTPITEIFQTTQDITEMSLEVNCNQEYEVERGEEGYDAGIKTQATEQKEALSEHLQEAMQQLEAKTQQQAFELADALSEQILAGELEIETQGHRIIIRIREKGSFLPGSATLTPSYQEVLAEVRQVIAQQPGKVKIEGHTDNLPISTARFRSNWELSAARAVSVAHELMKGGLLKPRRFEVVGKADTEPLDSANTPAARAQNRRVEILVVQGLDDVLSDEDKTLLQTPDGQDLLRELNLEPQYLFELSPDEIF
jgi:chemotaxis protein MotB